jgi:PIN domain nuclease of toxin-antitoxin system
LRLLLDSHYAFWLGLNWSELTSAELALIADPTNEIAVPSVAIWELRIKWEKRFVSGERKGKANPRDVLIALQSMEIPFVELTGEQAAASLTIALAHNDPFDELMLILAQELGMRLLTRDKKLKNHPLAHFA